MFWKNPNMNFQDHFLDWSTKIRLLFNFKMWINICYIYIVFAYVYINQIMAIVFITINCITTITMKYQRRFFLMRYTHIFYSTLMTRA